MAKKEIPEPEPLNLVPIMNLVTILIPVLLMAIKSLELAVIDTKLPAIGAPAPPSDDVPDKPPLNISVAITNSGFRIIGADNYLYPEGPPPKAEGGQAPPTIPCKSNASCRNTEDYDFSELTKKLMTIKDMAIDEERDSDNVIFMPSSNTRYEVLVKSMDAARKSGKGETSKKLFPNVVFAGGVQ